MFSKGSVKQSRGETNCGSIGPPKPRESANVHSPRLAPLPALNALKVQRLGGVGVGEADGDGEGEYPRRTDFWTSIENSVPTPLLFGLYENCCGVVYSGSHPGGPFPALGGTNCTTSAEDAAPLPRAINAIL